ncbi:M23 family metallopeptidase [Streptomyces marianii]|uniref:M23 family metallopeptidase n=1 Tax=Streptomyces marianii TaxID=1817406 RepID=A0A5R9E174_9ACTN|nr:M23 family metallopeptidase [Streptomyces marianii]
MISAEAAGWGTVGVMNRGRRVVTTALAAVLLVALAPVAARAAVWPVGPPRPAVVRGWEPPPSPYGRGHRGVDLAAPPGTEVRAAAPGRVSFAGPVAGRGVLSIELTGTGDFPLRTTYEPVRPLVPPGAVVAEGQVVAVVAAGSSHCPGGCLHWGLRQGEVYLDPLSLLPASALRRGPSRLLPVFGVPLPPRAPGVAAPGLAEASAAPSRAGADTVMALVLTVVAFFSHRALRLGRRSDRRGGDVGHGPGEGVGVAAGPGWRRRCGAGRRPGARRRRAEAPVVSGAEVQGGAVPDGAGASGTPIRDRAGAPWRWGRGCRGRGGGRRAPVRGRRSRGRFRTRRGRVSEVASSAPAQTGPSKHGPAVLPCEVGDLRGGFVPVAHSEQSGPHRAAHLSNGPSQPRRKGRGAPGGGDEDPGGTESEVPESRNSRWARSSRRARRSQEARRCRRCQEARRCRRPRVMRCATGPGRQCPASTGPNRPERGRAEL